jgi:peroxiredoxin/predicted 2-oxoglutarate/Fe(II)-dependent dioxygenase YbiX
MIGDPAPWFTVASTSSPNYHFDTVGGYRIILSFLGSCKFEQSQHILRNFLSLQEELAIAKIPFFGVTIDPDDVTFKDQISELTFFKLLWDFDRQVSELYGVCQASDDITSGSYTPTTFVLNQNLHIVQAFLVEDPDDHATQVLRFAKSLPTFEPSTLANRQAPVLFIPQVFEPELCRHLIDLYESDGGRDSGFMRQVDGKTVEILDYGFKKRRDVVITESSLLQTINELILRRVKPEIEKVFQFSITRFERHLVACYEASDQGFFNRHRDNTTKGTAHRRFAMSLNLNTGEYEGGCLRFPEYDSRLYRPETGEAVIFSCSLLHEATPVIHGRRFALLSFFYNDEDAQTREQNAKYVVLNSDRNAQTGRDASTDNGGDRPSATQTQRGFQPRSKKKRR